jgi:hypothetical protein
MRNIIWDSDSGPDVPDQKEGLLPVYSINSFKPSDHVESWVDNLLDRMSNTGAYVDTN